MLRAVPELLAHGEDVLREAMEQGKLVELLQEHRTPEPPKSERSRTIGQRTPDSAEAAHLLKKTRGGLTDDMEDDPMSETSSPTSPTESTAEDSENQTDGDPSPTDDKKQWKLRNMLENWAMEPSEQQTNDLNDIITDLEADALTEEPLNICYVGFQAVDLEIFNPGLTMDVLLTAGGKDSFAIKAIDSQRGGGTNITWHPGCKGEHSEFHVNAAIDTRGAGMVAGLLQEKKVKIDLFIFNFNVHSPSAIKAFMADKGPYSILAAAKCVHEKTRLLIPHYDKATLANLKGESVILALEEHPVEKANKALLDIQRVFNPSARRQIRHSHHWWVNFTPSRKGTAIPKPLPKPTPGAAQESPDESEADTSVAASSSTYASIARTTRASGASTPAKQGLSGRKIAVRPPAKVKDSGASDTSDDEDPKDSTTTPSSAAKRTQWQLAEGRSTTPGKATIAGKTPTRASGGAKRTPTGRT